MSSRPRATFPGGPGSGDDGGSGLTARTLSGFKWSFFTSAGQTLLSLAVVMVLARLLTPEEFGQLAIAAIFLALAATVGERGIGLALIQRYHLTERHVATAFTLSLALGALLTAILRALAPSLVGLAGEAGAAPILGALAFVPIVSAFGVVPENLLRRDLRFKPLMIAAILSQAVGGAVAVVLALMDQGVWALVWGLLVRQTVFSIVVIACRPPPRLLFALRETAELLDTGVGFSAIALFNVVAGRGVNLVIAHALGAAALGLYTRAFAIARAPASLGPVLTRVLLPAMARRQRRRDSLRRAHLLGIQTLALPALPASFMIAVSAPEIVAFVLGAQWEEAVPVVRVFALIGIVLASNALHVSAIRATGAVYRETWRRALFFILLVGGAWIGSRWGLAAVALAICAARLVLHLLLAHLTLSVLGLRWADLLRQYVPALWVTLWATPALWLAQETARDLMLPAVAALPLELAVWGAAALAALYLAPSFARPAFPHWAIARLPFDDMGRPGLYLRAALAHLAGRWPAPEPA